MPPPSPTPAILVLSGTGTVGSHIVRALSSHPHKNLTILVASHHPPPNPSLPSSQTTNPKIHSIPFDWSSPETWSNPFTYTTAPTTSSPPTTLLKIKAIYLQPPPLTLTGSKNSTDSLLTEFIEYACGQQGVRRFVLLLQSPSSSSSAVSRASEYLREMGGRGEVEWAVLRASLLQQNFARLAGLVRGIREESKIYSATGEGKIPWVSAEDVAAVAVRALTDRRPPNTEYLVLGPELLSYGEIAGILSDVLGRRIVHVGLSPAELEKRHQAFGMAECSAIMMSAMDTSVKFGAEDRTNDVVLAMTGAAPKRFRDFAESIKGVWEPGGGL